MRRGKTGKEMMPSESHVMPVGGLHSREGRFPKLPHTDLHRLFNEEEVGIAIPRVVILDQFTVWPEEERATLEHHPQ